MHKSKHKSKPHRRDSRENHGGWILDESSQRYLRYIQQPDGRWATEWYGEGVVDQDEIPRVTEEFEGLSTSPASTSSLDNYNLGDGSSKGKSKSSKSKGKGKHRARQDDTDAAGSHDVDQTYVGDDADYVDEQSPAVDVTAEQYEAAYAPDDATLEREAYEDDDDLMAAAGTQLGHQPLSYDTGSGYDAGRGESSSSVYAPVIDDDNDDGRLTPRPSPTTHIGAAEVDESVAQLGTLDPRYKIFPSSAFQPGNIFKVHWSEPQGSGLDTASSVSGKQSFSNPLGSHFFVGFRRFIIVATDEGHCTCVPILTYGNKACNKKGLKPSKHGIIYEGPRKPKTLDNEPKLGFDPIKARMYDGETLSRASRVNYSKLVTVEHNVRVFFIGHVTHSDVATVSNAVNACWSNKRHHRKGEVR